MTFSFAEVSNRLETKAILASFKGQLLKNDADFGHRKKKKEKVAGCASESPAIGAKCGTSSGSARYVIDYR
jgi:hypothetical protein